MLRRALLLAVLWCAAPLPARGGHAYAAIRRPEQLTVGVSDEFLGQLSPDGKTLFYLSNRNTIHEVYHQDLEAARAVQVFDEGADVTWTRVSPDGRHLLYISFRDEAAGQLCVRELRSSARGEVTANTGRRCLEDGSLAVQAQWIDPGAIALVSRPSLQGDLRLSRVTLPDKGRLQARPLLSRNLTSPAVSPDGRWLVYVPVQRFIDGVGPGFAARAALHLEAVRLDGAGLPAGAEPQPLALDLPGQSGQPVFSPDGKYLYLTQFFDDSNRDGTIDAGDHGVLFRVPFPSAADDAPARAARAFPEQLSDSSWNCQYPSPAATHLIATCSSGESLDVYSTPPDGLVPGEWDAERLRLEIEVATRRNDLLLLYRHLLQREPDAARQHLDMARLIMVHLELEEHDAAEFYARKLALIQDDPAVAGLGPVLLAHVAHRRGLSRDESGRAGAFRSESRARLRALSAPEGAQSAAARVLGHVVRSEINDALGDKAAARGELLAADLDEVAVPAVLEAFHERADALLRELDDADALYSLERKLSAHPRLLPEERLRYARAAVRARSRGLPLDDQQALLAREQGGVAADSELAFALALRQDVLRIRDEATAPQALAALAVLYRQQTRPERRHALMMDAGDRATTVGAVSIVEALVQLYVEDVPKGTRERQRAERLYERVMEARAYRERAAGQLAAARDDFQKVARHTGSFESHVEYIDLRLREGATPAALTAEYEHPEAGHSDAVLRFVRAYLIALSLPRISDLRQHEAAVSKATALLLGGWHALHGQPTVRVLLGALRHEEFLRTGELAVAQRADTQYLVALNQLARKPRYKALVLEQLGLLQAQAGNHRIALGYLESREKLPFPERAARLVHDLIKAETLAHLDRDADAAASASAALAACAGDAALAPYLPLVVDRAALYHLAAGQFAAALALYDQELPLLAAGSRNLLVVHLSRAAAAVGAAQPAQALRDLAVVDQGLRDKHLWEALRWPRASIDKTLRTYRIIAAGLRARAHRAAGQRDEALQALTTLAGLLQERQLATRSVEHLRPLALAEGQLAEALYQSDPAAAGRWLGKALRHAESYVRITKIPVGTDQAALLWLAAELNLRTQGRLNLDFGDRLRAIHQRMVAPSASPALRGYGRMMEMYLPIVAP